MTKDKVIGVFFGGKNPEHDISIITGQLIISGLKDLKKNVMPVYFDKTGRWFIGKKLGDMKVFTQNRIDEYKSMSEYYLDLPGSRGKMVFRKKGIVPTEVRIDMAFPAFHGQNGEDGTIQGLYEILGIPYVGCDVASSAITMDKVTTKLMYQANGIPTKKFSYYSLHEWEKSANKVIADIKKKLKGNLFIKPARLGSSIGISKVHNEKELKFGLEVAFHYEDKVLVEESVDNLMDITCCLIGNDQPVASLLQESAYAKDFFSYEDKYLKDGGAQLGQAEKTLHIPARLDKKTTEEIRDLAMKAYKYLGCSGIARVDVLYDKKSKKYFLTEVNTLPGTIYHHLWKKSGVGLGELLQKLLDYATERFEAKERITYTFESSVLSQTGSAKLSAKLFNK